MYVAAFAPPVNPGSNPVIVTASPTAGVPDTVTTVDELDELVIALDVPVVNGATEKFVPYFVSKIFGPAGVAITPIFFIAGVICPAR